MNLLFRAEAPLECSIMSDKKPSNATASRAPVQARSDQPVSTDVYSRPVVDNRCLQENGKLETVQQPSFHTETREPRYADACKMNLTLWPLRSFPVILLAYACALLHYAEYSCCVAAVVRWFVGQLHYTQDILRRPSLTRHTI